LRFQLVFEVLRMKKLLMWLVLSVMVLSTVLFTLGCPKPAAPADPATPAPAGDDTSGALDEGGE
jgi:hypothetical protein